MCVRHQAELNLSILGEKKRVKTPVTGRGKTNENITENNITTDPRVTFTTDEMVDLLNHLQEVLDVLKASPPVVRINNVCSQNGAICWFDKLKQHMEWATTISDDKEYYLDGLIFENDLDQGCKQASRLLGAVFPIETSCSDLTPIDNIWYLCRKLKARRNQVRVHHHGMATRMFMRRTAEPASTIVAYSLPCAWCTDALLVIALFVVGARQAHRRARVPQAQEAWREAAGWHAPCGIHFCRFAA